MLLINIIAICCICVGIEVNGALNYNVHLFYYPWYGAPSVSGHFVHWNGGGHDPNKGDITSNYWPQLGPYDSCDPKILAQHMSWIASSGAGTIINSWWGRGGFEDHCVAAIMDAANGQHIKVGFHIEPYGGRTPQSVVSDVEYINGKYGSHPAYYRDPERANRTAFYIFNSLLSADWSPIEGLKKENIILHQTTNTALGKHFSGFYNYAIWGDRKIVDIWKVMNTFCTANDMVCSPSIGPGYIDRRAVPTSVAQIFDRNNGTFYDNNWGFVAEAPKSHWLSITSFNEWHEGSMLEPASHSPPSGIDYLSYNGAYGKTGNASENSYLERTAHWISEWAKRV